MGSAAGAVSLVYRKKLLEPIRRKVNQLASGKFEIFLWTPTLRVDSRFRNKSRCSHDQNRKPVETI